MRIALRPTTPAASRSLSRIARVMVDSRSGESEETVVGCFQASGQKCCGDNTCEREKYLRQKNVDSSLKQMMTV
jgi:hypothetical protein